jgi:hypothetical protein
VGTLHVHRGRRGEHERIPVPEIIAVLVFTTTEAFEGVGHLFEREAELLDTDSEAENNQWADIWDELTAPGLLVDSADGRERFDIAWIHFKHGRAWWWPLYNSQKTVLRKSRGIG